MVKTNLETELHTGSASFQFLGRAQVNEETFPKEDKVSDSGWKYRRASFQLKISDKNSQYVQLMGGRASVDPVVYVRNQDGQPFQLKWDMRDNEDVLKNVNQFDFISLYLEKDENGKLIEKKFVSEVDAIDYLADHLDNDTKVRVSGNIEYQHYNGQISRSFNVRRIVRVDNDAEGYARIQQTYLLDEHSLSRKWEKELEENGQTIIGAKVPQYVGKENGKIIKKTLAFPQQFVVKTTPENLEKTTKLVEKFFKVGKKVVREATLINNVVFGYETSRGNVEITPELQDLIDLGIMTKEQIEDEMTITGKRVDETVFEKPVLRTGEGNGGIMIVDRYAPEALLMPVDDEDVPEDTTFKDNDTEDTDKDDPFSDDLFA